MIYHFTVHDTQTFDPDVSGAGLWDYIHCTVKILSGVSVTFRFHPETQALVGGTVTFPPEYPSNLAQATVEFLKNGATGAGIKTEWSQQ